MKRSKKKTHTQKKNQPKQRVTQGRWITPGAAEGDLKTVEEDLDLKEKESR